MSTPERLYTTKELAAKYGFTRQWITQLCVKGIIPARKLGGVYLVAESDLGAVENRNRLRGRSRVERAGGPAKEG